MIHIDLTILLDWSKKSCILFYQAAIFNKNKFNFLKLQYYILSWNFEKEISQFKFKP